MHLIIIPLGRGRGRGRGRGKPESKEWQPVTKLGRLVKDGKIKTIEEIYNFSLAIKVNLKQHKLEIEISLNSRREYLFIASQYINLCS